MENNLLTDRIFTAQTTGPDKTRRFTLPELLAALWRRDIVSYTWLQPHQRHPWHAFVCQLSAIALEDASHQDLEGEAPWIERLITMSGGVGAWLLANPRLREPAFMQPPIREESLQGWKSGRPGIGDLDILVDAKSVEVSRFRGMGVPAEVYAYGLVTLQTTQGYLGAGSYGISRMNGGSSTRPGVSLVKHEDPGARMIRDVRLMREAEEGVREKLGFAPREGLRLLWSHPWEGARDEGLTIESLHPFFIEICRRVRLTREGQVLHTWRKSTKSARVAAKERHGVMGDPWAPTHAEDEKALTVDRRGFDYRVAAPILLGIGWEPPITARVTPQDWGDHAWLMRALVRGEGKTEGFFERRVSVPAHIISMIKSGGLFEIAARAEGWLTITSEFAWRVLGPATRRIERTTQGEQAFRARVDAAFFPSLFASFGRDGLMSDAEAAEAWLGQLTTFGEEVLLTMISGARLSSGSRARSIAQAEGMFSSLARRYKEAQGGDRAE